VQEDKGYEMHKKMCKVAVEKASIGKSVTDEP
jgi:hypothetical protein